MQQTDTKRDIEGLDSQPALHIIFGAAGSQPRELMPTGVRRKEKSTLDGQIAARECSEQMHPGDFFIH